MSSFQQILRDAKSRIEETDSVGAVTLIAEGYRVLDVREPEEYEQGVFQTLSIFQEEYWNQTLRIKSQIMNNH